MNTPYAVLSFLFFLAQAAVVVYLRKHPSGTDARWLFAVLEIAIVFLTTVAYLSLKPKKEDLTKKKILSPPTTEKTPTSPSLLPELQKSQQQEKLLEERISHLEGEKSIAHQNIAALEQELSAKNMTIDSLNVSVHDAMASLSACAISIQDLTNDMEQLAIQLEQEHRQHAIEIRTLLGKSVSSTSLKKPFRLALSPPSTLLLLLTQFQKSLEHPQNSPSEYRPLVRRKFFDLAKQFGTTPFAIFSIDQPSDYFLSAKIPPSILIQDFHEVINAHKSTFEKLKGYQPYHLSDPRLGDGRWTVFRIHYEHLLDLVALAPSSG
jgi:hypothetical protein